MVACAPAAAPAPSAAQASAASLPPPETTTLRIEALAPCDTAYWMSDAFLREEGFTTIEYGKGDTAIGTADLGSSYGNTLVGAVDAAWPLVAVAGLHTGCIQIFARPGIAAVADLRGKTIAVNTKTVKSGELAAIPTVPYGFLVSLFAHVGMQPADANFVEIGGDKNVVTNFVDGKADAVFTASIQGPILQANPKNPGKVILDTSLDKPWSQNYCCVLVTNREWARTNPVALKRATRAILRGVDAGKVDRRATARAAIEQGTFKANAAITEQVLYDVIKDESFDWRDYDPEDTIRFFALRLADSKLIKKTPQQILSEGTDFTWFRQLRKELKG